MPRTARIDPAQLSEFATLIVNWMWAQRPPLNIALFAAELGLPKTTVWAWVREGRLPDPVTLGRIATHTGIPLEDLYVACGYPIPGVSSDEIEHDPFLDMIARVQRDPRFSAASKQAIIDSLVRIESGEAKAERERMLAQEHGVTPAPAPAQHDASIYKERPTMLDLPTVPAAPAGPAGQGSGERTRRNRQDRRRKAQEQEVADSHSDSQDSQTRQSTTQKDALVRPR